MQIIIAQRECLGRVCSKGVSTDRQYIYDIIMCYQQSTVLY